MVSSFDGGPLATDIHGHNLKIDRVNAEFLAMRHGLRPIDEQFDCMRQQLKMASVVHFDVGCKNIFFKNGAVTLGDFDAATVKGSMASRVHPWGNPPHSDNPKIWEQLKNRTNGACFRHRNDETGHQIRAPTGFMRFASHGRAMPHQRHAKL